MEVKKTETKTKDVTTTVGIRCDLCKEVSEYADGWIKRAETYKDPNVQFIDRFEAYSVESWPGYYLKRGLRADFCPKCAQKVAEALKSLGVEIEEFEVEM
jgi:hypothetical protein